MSGPHRLACLVGPFLAVVAALGGDRLEFRAKLSVAQEVPAPAPGSVTLEEGRIAIEFSKDLSEAKVRLEVDPASAVTNAHFHCGRPGLTGPVAFGLLAPGNFVFDGNVAKGVLTNADFTGNDCVPGIGRPVNNIAALAFAMRDGLVYANVHTAANASGEIRGQMLPASDDDDANGNAKGKGKGHGQGNDDDSDDD